MGPFATFLATHPEVSPLNGCCTNTTPNFLAEGIDCAIHVGDVDALSVVSIRLGGTTHRRGVAGAGGRDEGLNQPEDLANLPWVALAPYNRHEVRLCRWSTVKTMHWRFNHAVTDSLRCGVRFCGRWRGDRVGMGIPGDDLARGALVHLVPDWRAPTIPIHLIYPYAGSYPAKLRRFVEVMRDSLGNGPDFFNEESFN